MVTAIGKFIRDDDYLSHNPLDGELKESRLLIIFDGVEEALLVVVNSCAKYIKERSNINWQSESSFDKCLSRLHNHNNDDKIIVNQCLAWLNLEEAYLESANLKGANLKGANLKGANLEGTILERVNCEGANLKGAIMDDDVRRQIESSSTDKHR